MEAVEAGTGAPNRRGLPFWANYQVGLLAAQFLFGMAVNLLGFGDETKGTAKVFSTVFLVIHFVIALALLVGAIVALVQARKSAPRFNGLALTGVIVVALTVIVGFATMAADNDWLSYLMAVGFIVSLMLYVSMLVRLNRTVAPPTA
ncbi:MAG TPA: hypothetical protein VF054_01425 [Micromonosporaceae bacterium]